MFKDTDEALARLEAELLQEDACAQTEEDREAGDGYEEDYDRTEEFPEEALLYEKTASWDEPMVYQNFSNNYGQEDYRAYNADTSDEDLEEYSEEVFRGESSGGITALVMIVCFLLLGITAFLLFLLYLQRGGL